MQMCDVFYGQVVKGSLHLLFVFVVVVLLFLTSVLILML